jgi:hypothetical protein
LMLGRAGNHFNVTSMKPQIKSPVNFVFFSIA